MPKLFSAQRAASKAKRAAPSEVASGERGAALAPPAYGIDLLDQAPASGATIQRKASLSERDELLLKTQFEQNATRDYTAKEAGTLRTRDGQEIAQVARGAAVEMLADPRRWTRLQLKSGFGGRAHTFAPARVAGQLGWFRTSKVDTGVDLLSGGSASGPTERPAETNKDQKGNRVVDTLFETKLAKLLRDDAGFYSYHLATIRGIAKAAGLKARSGEELWEKIASDDVAYAESLVDLKTAVEQYLTNEVDFTKFDTVYNKYRANFPERAPEGTPLPRGRKQAVLWEPAKKQRVGNMTIRSAQTYLRTSFDPGSYGLTKTAEGGANALPVGADERTNAADEQRSALGLPFTAGPSGTMVYALAVFDLFPQNITSVSREIFALSLATYLVFHGHHSFFESLVPLSIDFKTKREFYMWMFDTLARGYSKSLATRARSLYAGFYQD